jgi:hydrogenase maturation protease
MSDGAEVLVLGIGNLLWADEGFGPRALAELQGRHVFPAGVELVDGGTQGLYLMPMVRAARRLLVLDAVDFGRPPGELVILRDAEIPRLMGAKRLSLHQTTFMDVLAAVELLGGGPKAMVVVGVQAGQLDDFGGGLTPEVEGRLDEALAAAVGQLIEWGFCPLDLNRES